MSLVGSQGGTGAPAGGSKNEKGSEKFTGKRRVGTEQGWTLGEGGEGGALWPAALHLRTCSGVATLPVPMAQTGS